MRRDRDDGDNAHSQHRARKTEAKYHHEQRGKNEENERVLVVGEDKKRGQRWNAQEAKRVENSLAVQHVEEAGAKQDERERRHDGHAEDVAKPPRAEEGQPGAGFNEEQRPRSAERARDRGGASDGDEEKPDQGSAAGEVEGAAKHVRERQSGDDDFDGIGQRDTEGKGEVVAVKDVGKRVGEETDREVLNPKVPGPQDDQGEEHAIGEPDGGDALRTIR